MTPSLVERVRGKSITTQEASITTATVEIKTVTVSGKQLTLSTFRQITDEDIIDEKTLQLRGVPWGVVNYFWKNCHRDAYGDEYDHIHVLWQRNQELRLAGPGWNLPDHFHTLHRRYLDLLGQDILTYCAGGGRFDLKNDAKAIEIDDGTGRADRITLSSDLQTLHNHGPEFGKEWRDYEQRWYTDAAENISRQCQQDGLRVWEPGQPVRRLSEHARLAMLDYRDRYRAIYRDLANLNHLFIAV